MDDADIEWVKDLLRLLFVEAPLFVGGGANALWTYAGGEAIPQPVQWIIGALLIWTSLALLRGFLRRKARGSQ